MCMSGKPCTSCLQARGTVKTKINDNSQLIWLHQIFNSKVRALKRLQNSQMIVFIVSAYLHCMLHQNVQNIKCLQTTVPQKSSKSH